MDITIKNRCTWHLRMIAEADQPPIMQWLEVPDELMRFADMHDEDLAFRHWKQAGVVMNYLPPPDIDDFLDAIRKHHKVRVLVHEVEDFHAWLEGEQWPTCVASIGEDL